MPISANQIWVWIAGGLLGLLIVVAVFTLKLPKQERVERNIIPLKQLPPAPYFPYDLENPDNKQKLPKKLEEVSGLTFVGQNLTAMVQDEQGKIYIYNYKEEDVTEEIKFNSDGDYEGLEIVGDHAYVMESNGVLHQVMNFLDKEPIARKYKTLLSGRNNVEGLGYSPENEQLLLACKEAPGIYGKSYPNTRAVYAFSLNEMEMNTEPFIQIDFYQLSQLLIAYATNEFEREYAADFDPDGDDAFKPSGIAVHPLSGDIYIIGTVGKLLVIFDRDGKLKNVKPLDKDTFKQPEGICFAPDGTLFISNEGKSGKGNLLIFRQKKG